MIGRCQAGKELLLESLLLFGGYSSLGRMRIEHEGSVAHIDETPGIDAEGRREELLEGSCRCGISDQVGEIGFLEVGPSEVAENGTVGDLVLKLESASSETERYQDDG
jgi:hypothetical protein